MQSWEHIFKSSSHIESTFIFSSIFLGALNNVNRSEGNLQPPASAEDKHINAEVQPMKTESTEEPVVETQPPTVAEIKPSVPNFQPTSQNQSSQDANAVAQLAPATDVQSQQQISEGNEQVNNHSRNSATI